jgi:hypothetical protein
MCSLTPSTARHDVDSLEPEAWPQHFEWLRERLETMQRVFAPVVKGLVQGDAE